MEEVKFEIKPIDRDQWAIFKQDEEVHPTTWCFGMYIDGKLVGFNAVMKPFHKSKAAWGHRLVILPEHRGKGLGLKFDQWVGEWLKDKGLSYHTITTNPGLEKQFEASPLWEMLPGSNPKIFIYKI